MLGKSSWQHRTAKAHHHLPGCRCCTRSRVVALWTYDLLQTLPFTSGAAWSVCVGRNTHCEVWSGFGFFFRILHADWQPLETAFSGASLFLCMPGLRGSAGLYHLNTIGRWSACSTVSALDLRFVPDTLLFLLGQHRCCICSDTWKSVMGRIRSSRNHYRRTFPLNHLYFEAFLKRSKTKSTLSRAEHYVNYLTKSIEKIKKIQWCLSCNPVVTLLLFRKGKHTIMKCITNIMSWGRSGLLSARLPTFPSFWGSDAPPGYFLWLWFLC